MLVFKFKEDDLFTAPKNYALVHCVSSDFALGKGIAKNFADLGVKKELIEKYSNESRKVGKAFMTNATDWKCEFSLCTKEFYHDKPNYQTLTKALMSLRNQCVQNDIHLLAMPKIGCGLDKLELPKVVAVVNMVFKSKSSNNYDFKIIMYV